MSSSSRERIQGPLEQDPHHIRISNSEIKNAPSQGILDSSANGVIGWNEYINLDVHHNGGTTPNYWRHGFYIGTPNNLVEGCDVHHNSAYGIQLQYAPAAKNILRNNKTHDNLWGGVVVFMTGSGNLVYDNLVYDNAEIGIQIDAGAANTELYNNTVYQNGVSGTHHYGGIWIGAQGTGTPNTSVVNNIAYQNCADFVDQGTSTVQSHNLFGTDPRFVNAAGRNLHLLADSPAIDAGSTLSEVAADFDGYLHVQDAAYDIGAYEFH